ncbi:hypothetical protein ACFV7Q_17360 [Streptomyces sp. NPDC059851]|uniref:hypothetical protein n=1 Tax=Streptomyces sp. NPDC059851 TaxID=3346971 RepID=UPI00365909C9
MTLPTSVASDSRFGMWETDADQMLTCLTIRHADWEGSGGLASPGGTSNLPTAIKQPVIAGQVVPYASGCGNDLAEEELSPLETTPAPMWRPSSAHLTELGIPKTCKNLSVASPRGHDTNAPTLTKAGRISGC